MATINYARYDTETQMYFNSTLDLPSTNRKYYLMFVDDYTSVGRPSGKYWCVGKTYVAPTSSSTWSFYVSTSIYDERNCYLREVSSSVYSNYTVGNIYSSLTGTGPQKPVAMIKTVYKYRIAYHSNGGTWVDEGTTIIYQPDYQDWYEEDSATTHTVYPSTPSGYTLEPPTGKILLGWATTSTGSPVTSARVTSTTSGATLHFYAIFASKDYKYRIAYHANGGNWESEESTIVYVPANGWTEEYFETEHNIYPSTPSGYVLNPPQGKELNGWALTSDGEPVSYGTVKSTTSGATLHFYAVWKDSITLFYWFGNEPTDANNIQTGKQRVMTADMWDSFADRVDLLASICGVSVSISRPSSGSSMNHAQYNSAVSALSTIKATKTAFRNVTLPSTVSKGDSIAASQFQGTGSIKGALNAMINLL